MKSFAHHRLFQAASTTTIAFVLLARSLGSDFNAAPFGLPLPEGNGVMWEDPREIHRVLVHFKDATPSLDKVRLEYWGSWWPERHLPKDREPGGGDMGWMELGNWWKYGWRVADTEAKTDGKTITFTFRPVNAKEFPKFKDYAAAFRYTLKIRVVSDEKLGPVEKIEAFTDSKLEPRRIRLSWKKTPPLDTAVEAFNGRIESFKTSDLYLSSSIRVQTVANPDPNTFDRTLVTVRMRTNRFTFKVDDLGQGPLWLPHLGVVVWDERKGQHYRDFERAMRTNAVKTLYDRIAEMPEQTWRAAWDGMPPKKSHIYFPLGLDGGRQRFRLNADGSIDWRSNDHYLKNRPGKDTPRLALEKGGVRLRFGLPSKPVHRTLQEESLPICITTWDVDGVQVKQTAFVTELEGARERVESTSPSPQPSPRGSGSWYLQDNCPYGENGRRSLNGKRLRQKKAEGPQGNCPRK